MKLSRGLGAAVLGGAMAVGACSGAQTEAKSPSRGEIPKELLDIRGPAKSEKESTDSVRPSPEMKPYLAPPQNEREALELLGICLATREAVRSFESTITKLPLPKSCRSIQAVYEHSERLVEACEPLTESGLLPNMELMGKINVIRLGIAELQKQMLSFQKKHSECFEDQPRQPAMDNPDFL